MKKSRNPQASLFETLYPAPETVPAPPPAVQAVPVALAPIIETEPPQEAPDPVITPPAVAPVMTLPALKASDFTAPEIVTLRDHLVLIQALVYRLMLGLIREEQGRAFEALEEAIVALESRDLPPVTRAAFTADWAVDPAAVSAYLATQWIRLWRNDEQRTMLGIAARQVRDIKDLAAFHALAKMTAKYCGISYEESRPIFAQYR